VHRAPAAAVRLRGAGVKVLFSGLLVLIAAGLAYFIALGLLHR
jgi:hypothetical protein